MGVSTAFTTQVNRPGGVATRRGVGPRRLDPPGF